jgi:hypothetical protein
VTILTEPKAARLGIRRSNFTKVICRPMHQQSARDTNLPGKVQNAIVAVVFDKDSDIAYAMLLLDTFPAGFQFELYS